MGIAAPEAKSSRGEADGRWNGCGSGAPEAVYTDVSGWVSALDRQTLTPTGLSACPEAVRQPRRQAGVENPGGGALDVVG